MLHFVVLKVIVNDQEGRSIHIRLLLTYIVVELVVAVVVCFRWKVNCENDSMSDRLDSVSRFPFCLFFLFFLSQKVLVKK